MLKLYNKSNILSRVFLKIAEKPKTIEEKRLPKNQRTAFNLPHSVDSNLPAHRSLRGQAGKRLKVLQETSMAILRIYELPAVLKMIAQKACRLLQTDACSIVLLKDNKKESPFRMSHNLGEGYEKTKMVTLEEEIAGKVARKQKPKVIINLPQFFEEKKDSFSLAWVKRRGFVSLLSFPIVGQEGSLGAINLYSRKEYSFTSSEMALLSLFLRFGTIAIENAQLFEETKRKTTSLRSELQSADKELSSLFEVSKAIFSVLDYQKILKLIVDHARLLTDAVECSLFLTSPSGENLECVVAVSRWAEQIKSTPLRVGEGITGWVAKTGVAELVNQAQLDPRIKHIPGTPIEPLSILAVPLTVKGKVRGVVTLYKLHNEIFEDSDLRIVTIFASQAVIAIENAKLYEETRRLSTIDDLTGLYNSRYFYEALEKEIVRTNRYGTSFSLLIFDIDDFKIYNDNFGHQAGDEILHNLGRLIPSLVRKVDIIARYGGEEFAVILPQTTRASAEILAERIRKEVEEHHFLIRGIERESKITISVGVANYPEDASSQKELVRAADTALYAAKRIGKNRICSFSSTLS